MRGLEPCKTSLGVPSRKKTTTTKKQQQQQQQKQKTSKQRNTGKVLRTSAWEARKSDLRR